MCIGRYSKLHKSAESVHFDPKTLPPIQYKYEYESKIKKKIKNKIEKYTMHLVFVWYTLLYNGENVHYIPFSIFYTAIVFNTSYSTIVATIIIIIITEYKTFNCGHSLATKSTQRSIFK